MVGGSIDLKVRLMKGVGSFGLQLTFNHEDPIDVGLALKDLRELTGMNPFNFSVSVPSLIIDRTRIKPRVLITNIQIIFTLFILLLNEIQPLLTLLTSNHSMVLSQVDLIFIGRLFPLSSL